MRALFVECFLIPYGGILVYLLLSLLFGESLLGMYGSAITVGVVAAIGNFKGSSRRFWVTLFLPGLLFFYHLYYLNAKPLGDPVLGTLFGPVDACSGSSCLYFLLFTLPLTISISYCIGIAAQRSLRAPALGPPN